ncbi:UDP-glucose:glycoprotein glucosyltransferase [Golovinomyces cichoracearum]|uniref:UDP-glucose:glycoprotein glucosyltransferase n=1 Tax=Golovinomyces cichoracearum TaxID=62708 RepID=A0A420J2S7_9PEZI|nr:UDP-glucose:glycoprotein glucosyltransferase [Golovinomyces cichoracearum]
MIEISKSEFYFRDMEGTKLSWSFPLIFLFTLYLASLHASASPSVTVDLITAFPAPPFLLELLETAADENANSYFPMLDRISEGFFSTASTDKELYERFLQALKDDGHLPNSECVSSYQLALSMRLSTPRIEAHYQYYHTDVEPSLNIEQGSSCSSWVFFKGNKYCSPSLDQALVPVISGLRSEELKFDRVLGNRSAPASILYADITSPEFAEFHKVLAKNARNGKSSYRLRHIKSKSREPRPLAIPGWGVELALKKTDYIVIDDRTDDESGTDTSVAENEILLDDDELENLRPLSSSELSSLAIKASSFILQSTSPLDSLVKLSQDFPKYSRVILSHNATQEFVSEHQYNRAQLIQDGHNIFWINGIQLLERQVEIFELTDLLRKEREIVNGLRELGLSALESIQLLSHSKLWSTQTLDGVNRYDWRDNDEGGHVIIWMNNLEKDKRYANWPYAITAMLQRGYPGQIPFVRRDAFNLVVPVDLSDPSDVSLIIGTLLSFVNRLIPIRIGLVPITNKPHAADQAKIVYHLIDTYGLQASIAYLRESSESKKLNVPNLSIFDRIIRERKVKVGRSRLSIEEILKRDEAQNQIISAQSWLERICADDALPPILIDGVIIARDDAWLQKVSQQINSDLQSLQETIALRQGQEKDNDFWLPSLFLDQAVRHRNPLIIPEDQKKLGIFELNLLVKQHPDAFKKLPRVLASTSNKSEWALMVLIVDLDTEAGKKLLSAAIDFCITAPSIEFFIVHNPASTSHVKLSANFYLQLKNNGLRDLERTNDFTAKLLSQEAIHVKAILDESKNFWRQFLPIIESLGLKPGQNSILINGRSVGPIPDTDSFKISDFEILLAYENKKRITPVYNAMKDLEIEDKILNPLQAAMIYSIVAATTTQKQNSMFDQELTLRMGQFDIWKSSHTVIESGDKNTASIHIFVLIDPASHLGQRWAPILKVLSELEGIYLKLYLNPKERLTELPVKRFYRYVLGSKPEFDENGVIKSPSGSFKGIPQEALLTVGLDIPPAWLVAPKVSIHDLDNIKLSTIKTNVKVTYELEYILIEGHSREAKGGRAPQGAQLVLGTKRNSLAGDTIIMANLGYFQFKANPGYYYISLKGERSSEIFNIDSLGQDGWSSLEVGQKNAVVLMSFKGTTLYPRLSRKPGMENEDVLAHSSSKKGIVFQSLELAKQILGKGVSVPQNQADINIFSVASGHLYERMLNIMMVSVMKHTKHSVKFWFIKQFLSPSFKDFIPHLAEEYGFTYEMVTYKWPHWLRAQSEKQREIWGYKILFLDVLFPLSLDKVIFVDADQIVRTDMIELVQLDLHGAPYGFTPMCDSRTEMEGFRFWKKGYWERFLRGLPYHISALYVVDLRHFRQIAAGDRLRQQYHALSADPASLSNLDQDLPNHMQNVLPIFSLPQEWLWCETWCSDESLKDAKTIDLCNNPLTKEPKLDRAKRQVPEWIVYDTEISELDKKRRMSDPDHAREKNPKSRSFDETPETKPFGKKDEL